MSKRNYVFIFLIAGLLYSMPFSADAKVINAKADTLSISLKAKPGELPSQYTRAGQGTLLAQMDEYPYRGRRMERRGKQAFDTGTSEAENIERGALADSILKMETGMEQGYRRLIAVIRNIKDVPADILQALNRLSGNRGLSHLLRLSALVLAVLLMGVGIEKLFRRVTSKLYKQIESAPPVGGLFKFWSGLLKLISELIGMIIFTLSGVILYVLIFGVGQKNARMILIASLVIILVSRVMAALSNMLCSPAVSRLRLIPLSDFAAAYLHRNIVRLVCYSVFGYIVCMFFNRLGISYPSFVFMALVLGTILLLAIALMVWKNRTPVAQAIIAGGISASQSGAWLKQQFAGIWHVLALFYLALVWLMWMGQFVFFQTRSRGVLFISLLIVPIYLALDRIGQWIVTATIGAADQLRRQSATQEIPAPITGETGQKSSEPAEAVEIEDHEARYVIIARRVVRACIIFAVAFWLLDVWGFDLPFGRALTNAIFDILVTLILAYILWNVTSNYISRKLQEAMPADEEGSSKEDDEWGAAATLGRSHTLLPMLRKSIGSVLVVIVTLMILSSIGVEITPLLAGAGIAGIAIGFGARKLVSDIFSGFFFLIDDAFRVGEYLKAGGISGRVEKITLRNLFLRHHRGMLQIVPYSDLGPVTNFMRGGLVIKFNLEFPYDTDIDKVRKTIKKVGNKMLEDEEFGQSFIKPVKSQGVRNIADSVMTIRVKFTAIPGKHFLIRREAYRQITEALEKKGIFYAHRKVIVDVAHHMTPGKIEERAEAAGKGVPGPSLDKDTGLAAGAAAALDTILEEKKEKK
jgi:small-conductance mechanosensitive channel